MAMGQWKKGWGWERLRGPQFIIDTLKCGLGRRRSDENKGKKSSTWEAGKPQGSGSSICPKSGKDSKKNQNVGAKSRLPLRGKKKKNGVNQAPKGEGLPYALVALGETCGGKRQMEGGGRTAGST